MDYLDKPDSKLCELLFKGDSNAFELIYNKYFKYLYRYVNHSLGSKEDSEEILHDLFLSIWQNRSNKKILEKVHIKHCPESDVLLPTAYLAKKFVETADGEIEIGNNSKLKQNKGY